MGTASGPIRGGTPSDICIGTAREGMRAIARIPSLEFVFWPNSPEEPSTEQTGPVPSGSRSVRCHRNRQTAHCPRLPPERRLLSGLLVLAGLDALAAPASTSKTGSQPSIILYTRYALEFLAVDVDEPGLLG